MTACKCSYQYIKELFQKSSLNIFLLSPDRLSVRNDVTPDKLNFRPDIEQNLFLNEFSTSRVCMALTKFVVTVPW